MFSKLIGVEGNCF